MSLLDTLLSALTGKSGAADASTNPLGLALNSLLEQNGGISGLMSKFSQGGLGEVFSSWIGMGENKSISADQISSLLGSQQMQSIASSLGIDPAQASGFLADYLPKIVDKLTPSGAVDPDADGASGLAALLPSLLSSFSGDKSAQA
ncbi:MAG: YidB family protein [Akkermansiaceae bacterium]